MSGHTPGPWMVYRGDESGAVIGVGSIPAARMICRMDFAGIRAAPIEANAYVIAAAPDLLRALLRLTESADAVAEAENTSAMDGDLEAARAAIRKATEPTPSPTDRGRGGR